MSGSFLAPYVYGALGKWPTKASAIAGSVVGIACAVLIPTVVKSSFPNIAQYCTTVNACAVATVLPLLVVPVVSTSTKKMDKDYVDPMFEAAEKMAEIISADDIRKQMQDDTFNEQKEK